MTTAAGAPVAGADVNQPRPRGVLPALCVTEITSWGVLFYAFPVLAPAVVRDTGWSAPTVTAAFSAALVVAAVCGIPVGRLLDRRGPRTTMTLGSVLGTVALLGVAAAPNLLCFVVAWLFAGAAMSGVLYQPAFASLVRWYGPRRVTALTTVTLVAGLASTVFAPFTEALAHHLSWRGVYLVLAGVLAVVTIPLHAVALRLPWLDAAPDGGAGRSGDRNDGAVIRGRAFLLLVVSMTLVSFAMYAAVINLVPLLTARGASTTLAAWALGLVGVGQVTGRLGYSRFARATSVRVRTVVVLAAIAVTIAALAVLPGPVWLLVAITVLAGCSRGIATLLQATAVLDRWENAAYGTLNGLLAAPATAASAVGPWAGAALASLMGGYPHMFATVAGLAAIGTVLAVGSVPSRRGGDEDSA